MKFLAVAEKTAKDARGLLYFAAPCIYISICSFCRLYFSIIFFIIRFILLHFKIIAFVDSEFNFFISRFHFIIVFLIQLLAATSNKYILCYVYVMLCLRCIYGQWVKRVTILDGSHGSLVTVYVDPWPWHKGIPQLDI